MPALPTGTVTFLYTDVEGSTRRWEERPDVMRAAVERHLRLLRDAVECRRGHVFRNQGDGLCAAFATAPDGLAAVLAAQLALHGEPWPEDDPLRVRMALHTGAAEPQDGDYVGACLNRMGRLLAAGHGGQTLLSRATYDLVREALPTGVGLRDLGEHRLRDLVVPEQIFQLLHPDLPEAFPPLKTLGGRPNNLPVWPTPLIGREPEVEAVCRLVRRDGVRLTTLSGPGGVGKTRLAVQAAAELLDDFGDGVFLVDLAPIRDTALVVPTIGRVLAVQEMPGRPPLARLREHLAGKELLLVLDNCEQVIEVGPDLADLLSACPRLKLLTTSREPLRVRGERELPVPPLRLPGDSTPADLARNEAVRLFCERAVAVRPDFALTDANAPAVAGICHRLDGLPLAIELAAARLRLVSPDEVLARLSSRLGLLIGGARDLPARQRTLRDAIAWSHELLNAEEQALFRRLGVFVGGFTLAAVESVCGPAAADGELPEALGSLVDKSLVRRHDGADGGSRYAMLETIREYAREKLLGSGEADALHRAHALYYLALAEEGDLDFESGFEPVWADRLETEHDNLRAAVAWGAANDPELALRLATRLQSFWRLRGHVAEGHARLTELVTREGTPGGLPLRSRALQSAAMLTLWNGDEAGAVRLLEERAAVCRRIDDRPGLARTLQQIGNFAAGRGDAAAARPPIEESLAIARGIGDALGVGRAFESLAELDESLGDLAGARARLEESAAAYRGAGHLSPLTDALSTLARVAWYLGDDDAARRICDEQLAIGRSMGHSDFALWRRGCLALGQGEIALARSLFEEQLATSEVTGIAVAKAFALRGLGRTALREDDPATARPLFEQALAIAKEIGYRPVVADVLHDLGDLSLFQCDPAAPALLEESLAVSRELARSGAIWARWSTALPLQALGEAGRRRGDLAAASVLLRESLGVYAGMRPLNPETKAGLGRCLARCAALAVGRSRMGAAARLLGAAEALFSAAAPCVDPYVRRDHEATAAALRAAVGEQTFSAGCAQGRIMTPEKAIAYGLSDAE